MKEWGLTFKASNWKKTQKQDILSDLLADTTDWCSRLHTHVKPSLSCRFNTRLSAFRYTLFWDCATCRPNAHSREDRFKTAGVPVLIQNRSFKTFVSAHTKQTQQFPSEQKTVKLLQFRWRGLRGHTADCQMTCCHVTGAGQRLEKTVSASGFQISSAQALWRPLVDDMDHAEAAVTEGTLHNTSVPNKAA